MNLKGVRSGLIYLVRNERRKHEYPFRIVCAVVALPVLLTLLHADLTLESLPLLLYELAVIFVFGGIVVNFGLNFLVASILKALLPIPLETIYRALVIGHLPMLLSVFTVPSFTLFDDPRPLIGGLWAISLGCCVWLLSQVHRAGNNRPEQQPRAKISS